MNRPVVPREALVNLHADLSRKSMRLLTKDQLNKKFKDFKINVSDSYYDLKTIDKESNKLWGWSAIVLTITT